jgi:oxidase EvaA
LKIRQGLRFLKSLHHRSSSDSDILNWIEDRRNVVKNRIERIDLRDLKNWEFYDYGIQHSSGKFFQVQFRRNNLNGSEWDQPIINQPEIGILGFVTREIDGILHFLIQAKIEPGNINIVQLSPTVQSTKSNFTKVHKGESTPFVEYFLEGKSKILVDQLQSEQGSRFFRKRNRNIIIEIDDEIEHENYRWVSLGDLVAMTKYPNTVNMDSRTVLSCIHFGSYSFEHIELRDFIGGSSTDPSWLDSLLRRDIYQHSHPEILSMITDSRFRREFTSKKIYLSETNGWKLKDGIITRDDEKYFDVVGYRIFIENRESTIWDQPMIQPKSHGICCFFAKKFDGVFHLLVQLKDEIGSFDGVEMAPTIQLSEENMSKSPFYDEWITGIANERIILDVYQSEEGGRFFQEQNRNMIIEVDEIKSIPQNYIWMTLNQLKTFLQYNNYVNIQTRSILSSLPL